MIILITVGLFLLAFAGAALTIGSASVAERTDENFPRVMAMVWGVLTVLLAFSSGYMMGKP